MKKLLFLLFIISELFISCVEQEKYPSALDGLRIEDQTFSSAALKTVINVNTTLTDVMVTVIDTKTTYPANWLDVDINGKTITLTLMENITINDHTACVTLRDKGRDDVQMRFLDEKQPELSKARLALIQAVCFVIASGLGIFGVKPVMEM